MSKIEGHDIIRMLSDKGARWDTTWSHSICSYLKWIPQNCLIIASVSEVSKLHSDNEKRVFVFTTALCVFLACHAQTFAVHSASWPAAGLLHRIRPQSPAVRVAAASGLLLHAAQCRPCGELREGGQMKSTRSKSYCSSQSYMYPAANENTMSDTLLTGASFFVPRVKICSKFH